MIPGRIWFVSPAYLDGESFATLRERLREVVTRTPELAAIDLRFVVIDDSAGEDDRMDSLEEFADVTVIEAPFNLGHQRAIVYGLRTIASAVADRELVVTLDSDGEDKPEDLLRLLAPLLGDTDNPRRISLALRTKRRTSLRFKIMYLFFRILFRFLTGTSVRTGNYAAYWGWLAKRMLLHPHFDLCYSSSLLTLNRRITFVPCERGSRYAGRSRMGFSKLFMHGIRMLMPFADRIAIRALILFSVAFGLGLLMALAVIGVRAFTDAAIPGWALYVPVGLIILSFVALGNFITLFAVFSQSLGISLSHLDRASRTAGRASSPSERSGSPPPGDPRDDTLSGQRRGHRSTGGHRTARSGP